MITRRRARERGCPEGDLPADAVASPQAWLWPAPRVAAGTDDCPEALWNTLALAERCEAGLQLGRLRPPRAAILQGVDAVPTLRERCERALRRRFPGRIPRAHRRRLDQELSLLASSGLSGALLVVAALADHGRARAVPVQARGSAAASLVLHLLDVAPLDPVTHGLSFERFVEPGRAAPPDVDLDAGWDGRAALLHHLETVLGGDHALRAARLVREDSGAPGPGLPTGIATHPSAVALLPQGGRAQVPLQPTPDGAGVVAQWDARALRRAGYFVVDVLGNRALAALHQLHRSPRGDGPREPRGPAALLQDEPTATLVRTGRTLGCYHLESPPLRELLRRMGTHELDALIAAAALIRPGARRSGLVDQLLRAVRHRAAWQGQPDLLVFEEDLRRATRRLAGYDREASDRLLSALRRTRGGEPDAPLRQGFLDACRARGTPAATAERCWDQAATFSGASSSRAHCATAVHLGLRAAWWRAHHPAAFFAALLTHGGGYYTREVYLQEARREGLRLRPPCVNRGEAEFAPADNGRGVRLGWAQIRGLRAAAVRSIGDARRGGPFRSEADLARRAGLAPPDLDALARAGALPEQDPHRTDRSDAMLPLGTTGPHEAQEQRWRQEVAAYGVLLTAHPLDLVAPQLPGGLVPAADLARFAGARVGVAGWLVSVKTILDRSGHAMSFATFDHPSGLFDAALFPDVHQRCGARLAQSPGPWVIYGRVEDEPLAQALRAEDLVEVVPNAAPHPRCNHAK